MGKFAAVWLSIHFLTAHSVQHDQAGGSRTDGLRHADISTVGDSDLLRDVQLVRRSSMDGGTRARSYSVQHDKAGGSRTDGLRHAEVSTVGDSGLMRSSKQGGTSTQSVWVEAEVAPTGLIRSAV